MNHRDEIHGIEIQGEDPKVLRLSDGSALSLDSDAEDGQGHDWTLAGPDGSLRRDHLSVNEAMTLAGDEFAGYVKVRTRAELEWLRSVADWCGRRADLLAHDLDAAGRAALNGRGADGRRR